MQNYFQVAKELLTIRDFMRFAMTELNKNNAFFGHGTDNAWDESISLVLHVLHLPHDIDQAILDARLIEEERNKIVELLWHRVHDRIPTPYLIHESWFSGLSFYVDNRVLIPRSPIAELIENRFAPWIHEDQVKSILDIGTGSGCIAIACALAFPFVDVDAVDVSQDALTVAKINVEKYSLEDRVHLVTSDVFSNIFAKKYDVIVSNPPYVDQEDMANLPEEYRHEPELALKAGGDGLAIVEQILQSAYNYLNDKGILIVEVGNSAAALIEKYPNLPFVWLEFLHGHAEIFLLNKEDLQKI